MTVHAFKSRAALQAANAAQMPPTPRQPLRLGQILCDQGKLSADDLAACLTIQRRQDVQLGTILRAHGLISDQDIQAALVQQFAAPGVDLDQTPPDPELIEVGETDLFLQHACIPWRRICGKVVMAVSDPAGFERLRLLLVPGLRHADYVIATRDQVIRHLTRLCSATLSEKANIRCPERFSCRIWARPMRLPLVVLVLALLTAAAMLVPRAAMWLIYAWVMLTLVAVSFLRLVALAQAARNRWRRPTEMLPARGNHPSPRLPRVSVLVPLYREEKILPDLIRRLEITDYPKELLEICLILEAGDTSTRAAVDQIALPHWMRVIEVPPSRLKTKPRAMNYALDFCRGDIIGIYDAEDAPEADQISRIVQKLRNSPPDVACVQAYLDYYNPRQNWLSRCFTIEYAIWFRLVLQGVERLRLPVPLGGTSVFFRRHVLEEIGAWDAHNVTEDADLGMRLARHGYRCTFEPTTTFEEANCTTLPWIKQRSRWLKGYAMTWITHMRSPAQLWHQLGPRGFLTFQVILLGTLSNFLLAPAIWSFWLISLGFTPAFQPLLPGAAWWVLGWAFVLTETVLALLGLIATFGRERRFLMPWVLTMPFYWPLGSIAAYKAVYELLLAPFYWDKTSHGISQSDRISGRIDITSPAPPPSDWPKPRPRRS
ncbi:MAG: glycosyltransferase [Rhodobacteraceae bacterium]|nr:glycosyltransferase [Paracoccaceae bacterium]